MRHAWAALALAASANWAVAADLPLAHDAFETSVKTTVAPLAGKAVTGLKILHVSGDVGPWMDTGMSLRSGDRFTVVLNGKRWLSKTYDLTFEPDLLTWMRIGAEGPIFRGIGSAQTVTAQQSGMLQFKLYPVAGRWLDSKGRYDGEPAPVNPDASGGIDVAVIQWSRDADIAQQLKQIEGQGNAPSWVTAAVARLDPATAAPTGWNYLWELGPAEIFREASVASADGGPQRRIAMHAHNDVAILQKDAAITLTPDTKLQWQWKLDALPSAALEDSPLTHDYLSIAVEFDNGQDLTWFWSSGLPVGKSFRCPLAGWTQRETHVVARSGKEELGRWLREEKNILEDYKKAIGGPLPKRITRVWLIAVAVFKRGEGSGAIGDIRLSEGSKVMQVW